MAGDDEGDQGENRGEENDIVAAVERGKLYKLYIYYIAFVGVGVGVGGRRDVLSL